MVKNVLKSSAWEKTAPNFLSITPLDGRNYHKLAPLSQYFSELALNRARIYVELTYLQYLAKFRIAPILTAKQGKKLLNLHKNFDKSAMREVRKIEHTTNHDVKAVEYYLKLKLNKVGLKSHTEYLHWALASEDVNNLAYSLLLRDYHREVLLPLMDRALKQLAKLAEQADFPMLGRTHGQPASVTTLGKELAVYLSRMLMTLKGLRATKFYGKLGGAVGSYADQLAFNQHLNWPKLMGKYIQSLDLEPAPITTQILPYEHLASYFSQLRLIQETAVDLCQNLWWYVSFNYFSQAKKEGEVGSSIMPHKINPIYLEGAEGGFQLANSLLDFYSQKLPHSRLQRDLSDTTVRRSFGVAFGYSYLSWQSLIEALERLTPNPLALEQDLEQHWEILAAPVQNYLRTKGFAKPYELLKAKTRGHTFSREEWTKLIGSLQLETADQVYVLSLSPKVLSKTASQLAKQTISNYRRERS
jgi:adenylosuccinate lyase